MDPNDTDYATSGYDTNTTSLSSTVNEYVFENGIHPLLEVYDMRMLIKKGAATMRTMGRIRIYFQLMRYEH
jgi:hypothetical protein